MSDLFGGFSGPAGSRRPGIGNNGEGVESGRTPTAQGSPAGVRTPRDIMNAREARRRAEAEQQLLGTLDEDTQRKIDLERRRSAERRAAAAGVTGPARDSGYRTAASSAAGRTSGTYTAPPMPSAAPAAEQASSYPRKVYISNAPPQEGPAADYRGPAASSTARTRGVQLQDPPRTQQEPYIPPSISYSQNPQPQARQPQGSAPGTYSYGSAKATAQPQPAPQPPSAQQRPDASSFPHAFERWEELSAHWEGITSYWIRTLEIRAQDLGNMPPDIAQMSRQITDLSAAGANLFHAVVELQRLRASSERKFQRWFFETRDQQEQHATQMKGLRDELQETRSRGVTGGAAQADFERRTIEMKRELHISKEEARRAWEELGRKEADDLEIQRRLREGQAVFVGGIQVLPSEVVNRGASLRQAGGREVYATEPGAGEQAYEYNEPSPTDTDPFTEQRRPGPNIRPIPTAAGPTYDPTGQPPIPQSGRPVSPVQARPSTSTGPQGQGAQSFYNQPDTFLQGGVTGAPIPSRSAGEDERALESQGRPLPFTRSAAPSVQPYPASVTTAAAPQTSAPSRAYDMPPPPIPPSTLRPPPPEVISSPSVSSASSPELGERSSARPAFSPPSEPLRVVPGPARQAQQQPPGTDPDYEGEGFGDGEGWEEMEPSRHYHQSRLSDVLEEDEMSRGSLGSLRSRELGGGRGGGYRPHGAG